MIFNTTIFGSKLEVEYTYYPPVLGTYEDPAEAACVEIDSIFIGDTDIDIYDIMAQDVIDTIMQELYDYHS